MSTQMQRIAIALACVLMISIGQLLFRQAGLAIERRGGWFDPQVLGLLGAAMATYALATLLWVHLLRNVPLTLAYPVMGLSFVIVPLLSHLMFRESIGLNQALGALLIVGGVVLSQQQG